MKEAKTVLHTKAEINGVEQEVLVMPITRLDCIEDTAAVAETATDEDYIPVMDSADGGQMKKIKAKALFGADSLAGAAVLEAKAEAAAARAAAETAQNIANAAQETATNAQTAAATAANEAKAAADKAQEAVNNAQGTLITDDALSSTSANPVQNKAVYEALEAKFPKTGGEISGDISVTGNISATGNITGAKVYNAVWNADYAEGFDYEGDTPNPGEIVEMCGNNKVRVATAGSDMVIGVCSATYWALAGCSIDDIKRGVKVAVGIVGQLPVKVRGAVKYGDYIVCGGDGIGEARDKPGTGQVVGRSMESNASSEIKDVNCIIQIR